MNRKYSRATSTVDRAGTAQEWGLHGTRVLHHGDRVYAGEVRQDDGADRGSRAGSTRGQALPRRVGEQRGIQVFDVWESQEAFDAFGATLIPILSAEGIELSDPMVAEVRNVIKG